MDWKVSLYDLSIDSQEIEAVHSVMTNRWITMGGETAALEREIADRLHVEPSGVAMNSCTAALHASMHVLGLGPGDEVLVPSITFVASIACVKMVGATPVFVDSKSLMDFSMDPDDMKRKVTSKTKAIVVVHYGGFHAEMKKICEIAKEHGLKIIEDVAHGPLVNTDQGWLGTIGDIGCLSFFSTKNLTTGEGGMFISKDTELLEQARLFRSHYMNTNSLLKHQGKTTTYDITGVGMNYRMTDIGASIGRVQLRKYDQNQSKREQLVTIYRRRLINAKNISIPYSQFAIEGFSHHIFCILLHPRCNRTDIIEQLKQMGIQTSIHYPAAHLFSFYSKDEGTRSERLPIAEEIALRELTLPLHPRMEINHVNYVCDHLISIMERVGITDENRV